ncbi:hypothetical protein EFW57_04019 [Bacillus velezensis]|nr:hypothetical protein EFW57_04019 [Bacillus velezensis]
MHDISSFGFILCRKMTFNVKQSAFLTAHHMVYRHQLPGKGTCTA